MSHLYLSNSFEDDIARSCWYSAWWNVNNDGNCVLVFSLDIVSSKSHDQKFNILIANLLLHRDVPWFTPDIVYTQDQDSRISMKKPVSDKYWCMSLELIWSLTSRGMFGRTELVLGLGFGLQCESQFERPSSGAAGVWLSSWSELCNPGRFWQTHCQSQCQMIVVTYSG